MIIIKPLQKKGKRLPSPVGPRKIKVEGLSATRLSVRACGEKSEKAARKSGRVTERTSASDPLSGLGEEDYKELKEDAEEMGMDYEELFIKRNQEDIKEIAEELGVSKDRIEKRIRSSKEIRKIV